MEPTQVKQFFIDLFGETFEIYGLLGELTTVETTQITKLNKVNYFDFKITNPNDVSYYVVPVKWEINEMLGDFTKYVNLNVVQNTILQTGKGDLYFNRDKTKEIENAFKKVDTIEFKTYTLSKGYNRYKVKIKSVGYKKGYDHELIWLENIATPISATKNGEPCDIDEVILQYYEEFLPKQEKYWETESLYLHLDQVLSSIPSIGNNDIITEYSTSLFRK